MMNVVFGGGGFAREVAWLFNDVLALERADRKLEAFVASDEEAHSRSSIHGIPILTETEFFKRFHDHPLDAYIAVGSPQLKRKIHEKCVDSLAKLTFPPLVHPSVIMDRRPGAITLEQGVIACAGTILTTGIHLHEFAHVNLGCTIGHDSIIGAYCTLSPGVHVSGGVKLGAGCFIGTGSVLLEHVHVCDGAVIGAGATVVRSITEPGTYVGTPATRVTRP